MSGIINRKLDPLSLKPCCLEDVCFVEENSSGKASCLENSKVCSDDIPPLKLAGRCSVSVAHFHNTEASESSSSDQTKDNDLSPICRTPAESKFDPFAPGPDDLMLAPKKMKGSCMPRRHALSRDLTIDSEETAETDLTEDPSAEECFSELIFSSLLELIISTKLMEISVNKQEADSDQTEECKTPTSLPLLTGFSETCPPAPRRPTLFSKRFDHSICRKLDFESCLN
ncbi:hypothetical protein M5K25_013663 [Dendrobium thyrsiflorum]|uniref:Uncharacterized protein n=1 Tax=Dendrobium thyrsiflorum TaxID=117978 RepID=A0ABD0UTM9_DENTH